MSDSNTSTIGESNAKKEILEPNGCFVLTQPEKEINLNKKMSSLQKKHVLNIKQNGIPADELFFGVFFFLLGEDLRITKKQNKQTTKK